MARCPTTSKCMLGKVLTKVILLWPDLLLQFLALFVHHLCVHSPVKITPKHQVCVRVVFWYLENWNILFSQFYFISDFHVWRYISLQYCKGTSWPRSHCKSWSKSIEQSCPGNTKKLISCQMSLKLSCWPILLCQLSCWTVACCASTLSRRRKTGPIL